MKLIICDDNKMSSYDLPVKVEDYYMINYYYEDLGVTETIMLEAIDNKWVINSDESMSILDSNNLIPRVVLDSYISCQVRFGDFNKLIDLCVLPDNIGYVEVSIGNLQNILIGSSNACNIIYNNSKVLLNHGTIKLLEDGYYLEVNEAEKGKIYVNSKLIVRKKLYLGDVIFFSGLKIIWMDKYIKINNPNENLKLQGLSLIKRETSNDINRYNPVTETERNTKLYNESQLFFHTTRLKTKIIPETVVIESPPSKENQENMPMILSVGSSAIIGITSCMTGISAVHGLMTGDTDTFSAVLELVMCAMMLTACLLFPMITEMYQKRQLKKHEALRQKKYSEYLEQKINEINKIKQKQMTILRENNYSIDDIKSRILNNHNGVWQREIIDDDFLEVTLGIGNIKAEIEIQASMEQFSLYEDNLIDNVKKVLDDKRELQDVPINLSLAKNKINPFIVNASFKEKYINSIIIQLLFYYSGLDLKIVILTDEKNEGKWEYMKYMPHCWSNNREKRFFATNENEMQEISIYLEQEYDKRMGINKDDGELSTKVSDEGYKGFSEYYLIITDDFKNKKKLPIIEKIIQSSNNLGFSLLLFEDSVKNLPSRVEKFVNIEESFSNLCSKDLEIDNQITFVPLYGDLDMRTYGRILSNIPLLSSSASESIPTTLTFLDMMHVGKVEQLNILSRWSGNDPTGSLHTPIGMMANGKYIELDLHEKYHGPHGLIAGTTGSGKSEFIITYILSMAVNYNPDEVQFILIDYKGGGLAGAFENRETGVKIPHLVGTITNLDTSEMHRTLVSIKSELQRRQIRFNKARESLNEGTIDIYKYQRLYREGKVKEPMSHLFVISDEFAELKESQPDFMDELISTARIGRSLGIHLILATQKPSGVVNDQIWSNSRFKICLKVQTSDDSFEMLKKPDAANIKEVGRFYLQVGNDEIFEMGQSAWAGARYIPVDRAIKKMDDDVVFVDNCGNVIKKINDEVKAADNINHGEQITNVVNYLNEIAVREKISFKNLWLPSLEQSIKLKQLLVKYQDYKPVPYNIDVVVGEYDNPTNILQGLVKINLVLNNCIVIGIPGSGKESFLTTLIYSTCIHHTPYEVNYYILDFGSEALAVYKDMPHVGSVIKVDEKERVVKEFEYLEKEIQRRKKIFADYSGSYINYCQNSGKKLPLIVTVLNGYESYMENCGDTEDMLIHLLRDGIKYGIVFVVTSVAANSMRATTLDCFQKKIMLQIADPYDYSFVMNAPRGLEPKKCFGRGLIEVEDEVCEFQTACIDDNEEINTIIKNTSKQYNDYYQYKAKEIRLLPSKVMIEEMLKYCKDIRKIPIGYSRDDVDIFYYDFFKNKCNLIIGMDIISSAAFMCGIIDLFDSFKNIKLNIIDFLSCIETDGSANYYNQNYEVLFKDYFANNAQQIVINIIIGIGNYDVEIDGELLNNFNTIMNNLDKINNNYFIIIDDYERFKNAEVAEWYEKIDKSNGIWIGEGIKEQDVFVVNDVENINDDIISTYVIDNNNYTVLEGIGDENYESDDD